MGRDGDGGDGGVMDGCFFDISSSGCDADSRDVARARITCKLSPYATAVRIEAFRNTNDICLIRFAK